MQRRRFFPAKPVQQVPGRRVELAVQVRKEGAAAAAPPQPKTEVAWVSPAEALVSVGAKNDYGHPAARTVRDVEATGARVFRTDQHGSITLARASDGRIAGTPQRG